VNLSTSEREAGNQVLLVAPLRAVASEGELERESHHLGVEAIGRGGIEAGKRQVVDAKLGCRHVTSVQVRGVTET
jgi:hypothetical protein